ncbi:MAG: dienelactone hydrolase family protein [Steroidobacteraceae bacterium]
MPVVAATAPPAGTEALDVQWMTVSAPDLGPMLIAIARPAGKGPWPTVILLHGSHGFAQEYVQLAKAFAREGVLAVAACWFTGGGGVGARFVTPIACPEAPPMSEASGAVAMQSVDVLVQAVRSLPDVRADAIALFGHSRGGGAALNYVLEHAGVLAAILDSAGYPSEVVDRVSQVKAYILILHGTSDSPSDGGSAYTAVPMARSFVLALRKAGKRVQVHYYEGSGHNGIFASRTQFDDEARRGAAFVRQLSTD